MLDPVHLPHKHLFKTTVDTKIYKHTFMFFLRFKSLVNVFLEKKILTILFESEKQFYW